MLNSMGMTKQQAIIFFGSAAQLARALGITRGAVSLWQESLPIGRQCQIEVLTGGALKADRCLLRPFSQAKSGAATE